MGVGKQVEYITRICNQWLNLLNQMKKQALPQVQLLNVFLALIVSRFQYSWHGYASEAHIESIEKLLVKAK